MRRPCSTPRCEVDALALIGGLFWCARHAADEQERIVSQEAQHDEDGLALSIELRRYREDRRRWRERHPEARA